MIPIFNSYGIFHFNIFHFLLPIFNSYGIFVGSIIPAGFNIGKKLNCHDTFCPIGTSCQLISKRLIHVMYYLTGHCFSYYLFLLPIFNSYGIFHFNIFHFLPIFNSYGIFVGNIIPAGFNMGKKLNYHNTLCPIGTSCQLISKRLIHVMYYLTGHCFSYYLFLLPIFNSYGIFTSIF
jgi:hypothetical protein